VKKWGEGKRQGDRGRREEMIGDSEGDGELDLLWIDLVFSNVFLHFTKHKA
jgi:hypothetical protein